MKLLTHRQINQLTALLCAVYLVAAFLLQYFQDLLPCPLCILQRWVIFILLVMFLIGSFARTRLQNLLHASGTLLISLMGIFLSARHLWLIHHPSKTAEICAPNLLYLFKQLSFDMALKTLFWGSGDCATMAGKFLMIDIPYWTLLVFISLGLISIYQIIRKKHL